MTGELVRRLCLRLLNHQRAGDFNPFMNFREISSRLDFVLFSKKSVPFQDNTELCLQELYEIMMNMVEDGLLEYSPGINRESHSFRVTWNGISIDLGISEWISDVTEQLNNEYNGAFRDAIDSADWTGISQRISDQDKIEIISRIRALNVSIVQSSLSFEEKQNALKRVAAVQSLVEAPDSPWRLIVALLTAPMVTAFLNSAAILTLILGE